MGEYLALFLDLRSPLHVINVILSVIAFVIAVILFVALFRQRDPVRLAWLERPINSLLFLGLLIAFFTLLNPFYGMYAAFNSVASSGTGDPRVVSQGIIQMLMPINLYLLIAVIIGVVWFVLRMLHKSLKENLNMGRG